MRTVAFCEIEDYCRHSLQEQWPGVPCYDDVRTLTGDRLRADGIAVDGLPYGMERNHAIGNAVAPAVVQVIGEAIMTAAITTGKCDD